MATQYGSGEDRQDDRPSTSASGGTGASGGMSSGGGGGNAGAASAAASQIAGQARQATQQATEQARQLKDQAVSQAGQAAQQAKQEVGRQAAEAARMLREKGTSLIADQKSRAASTLEDISNALGDAGSRLESEQDNAIAGYVHGAADQVRVLADYLKNKPAESLVSDLTDAARRRPEYFVGGMFLVGLALARFAKSSGGTPAIRGGGQSDFAANAGYYGGQRYMDRDPMGDDPMGGNQASFPGSPIDRPAFTGGTASLGASGTTPAIGDVPDVISPSTNL